MDFGQVLLLDPTNVTPLTRTPWAGTAIYHKYKQNLGKDFKVSKQVGESWEFSCDPDYPSKILGSEILISDLVQQFPEQILSPKLCRHGHNSCEILVKLINAAQPLSLQVHPEDNNSQLQAHECGKPESWLILDAEPGAGLYLGFSRAISHGDLGNILRVGNHAAKELLQFVPVQPGDYFEIEPGVPHAIGPGITLLEPQRIRFGMSGKTYRMWDWGRKYGADGKLDMVNGRPRELHLDQSLLLIDPARQVGLDWVAGLKRQAKTSRLANHAQLSEYPANPFYQVRRIQAEDALQIQIDADCGYAVLLLLDGELELCGSNSKSIRMHEGFSGLAPFSCWPLRLKSIAPQLDLFVIQPSLASLQVT